MSCVPSSEIAKSTLPGQSNCTGIFAIGFSTRRVSSMRDSRTLLIDIVENARRIRAAVAPLSRQEFDANFMLRMGIAHTLQMIGEAARVLPDDARRQYSQIPWNQVVGMRHLLVHEYFRTDFDLVWQTAS